MPDKQQDQETEWTPTGHTVPVPRRDDFFGNLTKAAAPLLARLNGGSAAGKVVDVDVEEPPVWSYPLTYLASISGT
jgi:hypothetical protein